MIIYLSIFHTRNVNIQTLCFELRLSFYLKWGLGMKTNLHEMKYYFVKPRISWSYITLFLNIPLRTILIARGKRF